MDEKRAKMLDKISKLLALAENAGTPEEAKNASEKAERLMVEWGISEAMANANRTDDVKPEEIVTSSIKTTVRAYQAAQMDMMHRIARAMSLQGFRANDWSAYHVVGHESDVERYTMLINSLNLQVMSAMKKWWKSDREKYAWMTAHEQCGVRCEFIVSFANAAASRLLDMTKEQTETQEEKTPGVALALIDRKKAVQDHFDNFGTVSDKRRGYNGSSAAGFEAGKNAHLGEKGLGGRKALS